MSTTFEENSGVVPHDAMQDTSAPRANVEKLRNDIDAREAEALEWRKKNGFAETQAAPKAVPEAEAETQAAPKAKVSEVDTLLKELKEAEDALLEEMEKNTINISGYNMPLCHVEKAEKFVKGKGEKKRKNALLLIRTLGNAQAQPPHLRNKRSNQRKVTKTLGELVPDDVDFNEFLSYYQEHGKDFAMYAVYLEDFEKKKKAEKKRKNSVITWDEDGNAIQITKKQMHKQISDTIGAFDSRYR